MAPRFWSYWMQHFYFHTLAVIKILGHSKNFTHWKLRKITLLTFPQEMLPLREPTVAKPLPQSKGIFPPTITWKNWEAPKLASEKEKKKKDGKFDNCWFDTKRKFCIGPNKNPVLPETLKFPLITPAHTLNHWSTDKMTSFMNQCWWENINKTP